MLEVEHITSESESLPVNLAAPVGSQARVSPTPALAGPRDRRSQRGVRRSQSGGGTGLRASGVLGIHDQKQHFRVCQSMDRDLFRKVDTCKGKQGPSQEMTLG